VRLSHKVDYGIRVMCALAEIAAEGEARPTSSGALAEAKDIPPGFLDDILRILRNGGLVRSVRGSEGGWMLARAADAITVADIIRVIDGPLATVRGLRPDELASYGEHEPFISLWVAVRVALRSVLERVTVADLAAGRLPPEVQALVDVPDAWEPRRRGS
jgi:Rrf2 family protein